MVNIYLLIFYFISIVYSQEEWRAPDPPTSIKTKSTANSITLWWEPPDSHDQILVRGYTISYGIGTPSRKIVLEGVHIKSFTIEQLKANTTYVIALTAYNEADEEDSEKVFITATTEIEDKFDNDMYNHLKTPEIIEIIPMKNGIVELKWEDKNKDSSMKSYFVKYNVYGSDDESEIITVNKDVLIDDLESGVKYEFKVKVKDSDGNESDYSEKKTAMTIPDIITIDNNVECNFEKENEKSCKFYSDPESPLKWRLIDSKEPDSYYPLSRIDGIPDSSHYMILEASSDPYNTFGRLISPEYQITEGDHFCLTLWVYVASTSHGSFTIFVKPLKKEEHDIIYKERFEKMSTSHWSKLSLDIKKSHLIFKIIVEGQKSLTTDKFMIGVDDFAIKSGHCDSTWNDISTEQNDETYLDVLSLVKDYVKGDTRVHETKGLDGFPAVAIRRGVEIVVPYRSYLPERFYRNFAIVATVKLSDKKGGFLFGVLNAFDTIIALGVSITESGPSNMNISLYYTNTNNQVDSQILASFIIPDITYNWTHFALEVNEDAVILYFNCKKYQVKQVKRKPMQLPMDDVHKLYVASAGPIISQPFEVSFKDNKKIFFR
uniref:Fibronectin type-III domain-containing protein n=1 Tax=Parastrongyloides trichosuri TaxID=131310 RepID=A0A0N5A585_PARTI